MKLLFKNSIFLTIMVLITACSGGGSGSTTVNAKPAIDNVSEEHKTLVNQLKEVNVIDQTQDGKLIQTLKIAMYPKGSFQENFNTNNIVEQLKGINLAYSTVFGLYEPKGFKDIAKIAYLKGFSTSVEGLPEKGIVTYQGQSLGLNTTGSLILTANFNDYSVSGLVYNRKQENISLPNVELQKATFYKGAFSNDGKDREAVMFNGKTNEGYYKGAFTGPNAQEVIGYLLKEEHRNAYELFAGEQK